MRKIFSAPTLPDAHIVRGALEQAGIATRVFNENAQSALGEIPFNQAWPEVWILNDHDAPQAREVIRRIEQPQPIGSPVFCPHCHEENPSDFQTCWHCCGEF